MLFLSVYWLKSLISVGVIITLLMGIVLLYVLVYAFLISSITAQVLPDFRNAFIATFMITSFLLIFSSLGGFYGLIRKRNKLVIFYSVTMIIYFAAFLLLGSFMITYPSYLKNTCSNPDQTINSLTEAVDYANQTLGKTQNKYNLTQLRLLKRMGFQNYTADESLPVNAQNCEGWSNSTYIATNSLIFLQNFFNCSGWCNTSNDFNLYFLFTDVNRGVPNETCLNSLLQFFDEFGTIMQVSSFCAALVLFFILMSILCLCCHPDRGYEYDAMKFFKSTLMVELNEESDKEQK